MILHKCIWERGIFSGKDAQDFLITIEDYKVVNADELKKELAKSPRDITFHLQTYGRGMYSSLWDWNFAKEEDDSSTDEFQKSPPVCVHEWTNQGFHHIIMACKFCGQDAPSWVQINHDPQSR